jgi:hypothetical protein
MLRSVSENGAGVDIVPDRRSVYRLRARTHFRVGAGPADSDHTVEMHRRITVRFERVSTSSRKLQPAANLNGGNEPVLLSQRESGPPVTAY